MAAGPNLEGPCESQMSGAQGLGPSERGPLALLSPGTETGGRCCRTSQAESTSSPASTWPKSPMGEFTPQALPLGSFLLSPPTSVVLHTQSYAEQSWGQGKIRPRPCPPEELTTDSGQPVRHGSPEERAWQGLMEMWHLGFGGWPGIWWWRMLEGTCRRWGQPA